MIPAAKQPGRRAQKRRHEGSAYELGAAAQRLSQSFLIDVIYSRIWDGEAPEEGLGNSQSTAMLLVDGIMESTGRAIYGFHTRYYLGEEPKHDVKWSTKTNVDVSLQYHVDSPCQPTSPHARPAIKTNL